MRWVLVKDMESVCRSRAKLATEEKYGHILRQMRETGEAIVKKRGRLPTSIAYKYQKIRNLILEYENEMYDHFVDTYQHADDSLSADIESVSFKKDKRALGLGSVDGILGSEETVQASNKASKKSLSFGTAIDILNSDI